MMRIVVPPTTSMVKDAAYYCSPSTSSSSLSAVEPGYDLPAFYPLPTTNNNYWDAYNPLLYSSYYTQPQQHPPPAPPPFGLSAFGLYAHPSPSHPPSRSHAHAHAHAPVAIVSPTPRLGFSKFDALLDFAPDDLLEPSSSSPATTATLPRLLVSRTPTQPVSFSPSSLPITLPRHSPAAIVGTAPHYSSSPSSGHGHAPRKRGRHGDSDDDDEEHAEADATRRTKRARVSGSARAGARVGAGGAITREARLPLVPLPLPATLPRRLAPATAAAPRARGYRPSAAVSTRAHP